MSYYSAPHFDFGRSKERRKPLFSREVAIVICAILASSIIVCGICLYHTHKTLRTFEDSAVAPTNDIMDRLRLTRNLLAAIIAVQCLTVVIGMADFFM